MKNLKFAIVIISLLLTLPGTAPSLTPTTTQTDRWLHGSAGYARALELQREMKIPLVVYFYTDWCPYCRALDSDYFPSAPVQEYLKGVVKVRINPEHGPAEEAIAQKYNVRGYPAFFVIKTLSSQPRKVHPFRRGAKNLTPAEFANACAQGGVLSTPAQTTSARAAVAPKSLSATQPKLKAKIVEAPPSNTKADLPSVDSILDKYVAAIGGREAQKKITSRVTKGRIDVPGVSFGGTLEVYAKAPNKSLTITNVEPAGLVKQGFDGRTGWNVSENGLAGETFADFDFYRDIKLRELYTRMNVVDKVKDGLHQVYVVEAIPQNGSAERLYFDVDTGLLVRRDLTRPTSKGAVRAEVYYNDWRVVDGVKIPFRITQSMPAMKFVTTIEEIKQNVPVDDSIFRRP